MLTIQDQKFLIELLDKKELSFKNQDLFLTRSGFCNCVNRLLDFKLIKKRNLNNTTYAYSLTKEGLLLAILISGKQNQSIYALEFVTIP